MRELFRYADKNNDNALSLKEIVTLLKHLNIEVDHDQAKQIFEVSGKQEKESLFLNSKKENTSKFDGQICKSFCE